jgi:hypothetical protein
MSWQGNPCMHSPRCLILSRKWAIEHCHHRNNGCWSSISGLVWVREMARRAGGCQVRIMVVDQVYPATWQYHTTDSPEHRSTTTHPGWDGSLWERRHLQSTHKPWFQRRLTTSGGSCTPLISAAHLRFKIRTKSTGGNIEYSTIQIRDNVDTVIQKKQILCSYQRARA